MEKKYEELWQVNHLLTCLAEECSEVMEVIFEYNNTGNKNKIENIEFEINDVIGVAYLLKDKKILNFNEKNYLISTSGFNEFFKLANKISYQTHKSIRFGLTEEHKKELELLIVLFISLTSNHLIIKKWFKHDKKKEKVLKFMEIAREKIFN